MHRMGLRAARGIIMCNVIEISSIVLNTSYSKRIVVSPLNKFLSIWPFLVFGEENAQGC
jgi:hypothetical protein